MVFDIGGTFVKYGALDHSGNILEKGKFRTPKKSLSQLLNEMFDVVDTFKKQGELKGVSICCPGVVDSDRGIVYFGGCLEYLHEVNLKKIFRNKYNLAVSVENDGKAAALAELWRGSVKSVDHAVVLVLGSAIGGGVIIDGKLHRGKNFSAGEVSYMVGDPNGQKDCYDMCGFNASASGMVKEVAIANHLDPRADGQIVFEYIKPDNPHTWKIFTHFCRKVARMLVSLQYVLDPDCFIICGGISAQPIVCQQISQEVENMYKANPMYLLRPTIENSKLNNYANLYGALYHFIEEYMDDKDYHAEHRNIKCPECNHDMVAVI